MSQRANTDFVAPKVAAEIENWLTHLGAERRLSPKTLEAYRRDVLQFLAFLAGHLGGAPSLQDLAALKPADVRAFMAARRAKIIGSRSLMRALAGMRAFARFLERSGKGKVGALAAVRAPKIRKNPAAAAVGRRGQGHCRSRCHRRRRPRAVDSCPRRRRAWRALWLRLAHFRSAGAASAPISATATPLPSREKAASSAWCR